MIKISRTCLLRIYEFLKLMGIDPLVFITTIRGLGFYLKDLNEIKRQKGSDNSFHFGRTYPILHERFSASGTMSGHYFHQDLFVAQKVFDNNPIRHIDIGSRTDGFVAHVAVFRKIEVFDVRGQKSKVKNIVFNQADLMKLPDTLVDYCDSISSLHAIEHFGLGRYGEPINYFGHVIAIDNIYKILKKNGTFYFSVPIGTQRIEFNAHRVFSLEYLIKLLDPKFIIKSFSFINDKGNFFEDVHISNENIDSNFNCNYGCGIFELTRR
jgi:SAM-dependent methyltransferase